MSISASSQPTARTRGTPRMLAPDLARGLTLLGIAGANVTTSWIPASNAETGMMLGGVVDNSVWDKVAIMFGALFFHVRGLPMFSTMLGFGIGLISMSLYRRQFPLGAAQRALAKRYGWLAVFGLIHCVFLFWGDIMLSYGLLGMLLALCLSLKDKVLLWLAGVLFALNVVGMLIMGILIIALSSQPAIMQYFGPQASPAGGDFGDSYVGAQLLVGTIVAVSSPFTVPMQVLMLGPLMIIGFWAARRGVLSDIPAHRTLLVRTVWVGLAVIVLVGVPLGLSGIGVLPPSWEIGLFFINSALGVVTGPAIIALIALASEKIQQQVAQGRKLAEPLVAICALGKRSMTGYVLQSIVFLIFVTPFGLGWGIGKGAADSTLIGIGVWLFTLVVAYVLEKMNKPGPFEFVHRRLSYGKAGLPDHYGARMGK